MKRSFSCKFPTHLFCLAADSEAESPMGRKQAARGRREDQHDCTREPPNAAILGNTCPGHNSLRGNTTYEALSLKVRVTFMLIYCHACLTVALDQQQILTTTDPYYSNVRMVQHTLTGGHITDLQSLWID